VAPAAEAHDVTFVVEPPEGPGPWASADRQRVTQILLNLLSNGVKYNRPGGRVVIRLEQDTDGVTVRVRDTGAGIPADRMAQLFMPFERLGAEVSGVEGTGLGMALSQRLAEAMGGGLDATSRVGVGTEFRLALVAADPTLDLVDVPRPILLEPAGTGTAGTVLYVEDSRTNAKLVERLNAHEDRLKVLERIVTDRGYSLSDEIEALRHDDSSGVPLNTGKKERV